MIEHYIQKDIVDKLSRSSRLRFSQLKPGGMESNLFMYHLKQLIKAGYVSKVTGGYELGLMGLTYVDTLSLLDRRPRKQPKVISILALRNSWGEWLLGRRRLQPYINTLAFPSGKQHFGETPEVHARRELLEKTGLSVPLRHVGMADLRIHKDDQILTHVLGHIYSGVIDHDTPLSETAQYTYEWHKHIPLDAMPGTSELVKAILENKETHVFLLSEDFHY